jgi:tetratricopeptide (TPR) repeat protein
MEMFTNNLVTADDPRLNSVYDNFRHNLADICQSARDAGAPVILSTVVTNLKDCPPLASTHRANLSAEDLAQWKAAYQAGIRLWEAGKTHEAALKFREAVRLDDRYAELHFCLARCLAAEGNGAAAREHYVLARDLDALRFRADSRINEAIRQFAAEQQSAGVHLVDAEQAMSVESLSPGSVPGENLFYEHVHLTFEGNYQLARTMLDVVSATLPRLDSLRKESAVPTRQQCANALALTSWDELEMGRYMAEMTSRAPFINQFDHANRQAAVQEKLIALGRIAQQPEAMQAGAKLYAAAIEKSPGDWQLRNHSASLALQARQPALAEEQCRILVEEFPWEASFRCKLGLALAQMGKPADAIAHYYQALRISPDDSQTHSNLGNALRKLGRVPESLEHYEQALKLNPDNAEAHNNFGNALQQLGRISKAIEHYEAALQIRPDNAEAHNNFGNALQQSGRVAEAIKHYEKALQIRPDNPDAHNNLANVLLDVGRTAEGISHYRQALEIQPENAAAHCNLALALEQTGQLTDAVGHYKEALRLNPNLTPARARLSVLAGQEPP